MKKQYRLISNDDFSRVINTKQSVVRKEFVVYFNKNELENSRIGISTSKKLGHAVIRNRIRRQIRAMIDSIYDYKKGSKDIVIVVRHSYLNHSYRENFEILDAMFTEIIKK